MFKRVIRFLLYCVFDLVITFLSYIIPKDRNVFVFVSGHGGYDLRGNPKVLFLYFSSRKRCIYLLKTNKPQVIPGIIKHPSFRGFWYLLRSKYIFHDNNVPYPFLTGLFAFLGRFKIIQTWHGVGFKKIEQLDPNFRGTSKLFNYIRSRAYIAILATSEAIKEKFEKAFKSKKVYITGMPRNDVFFNPDLITKKYREKLGLNKFAKVILYAPTFRDKQYAYPFTEEFLEKLDKWLESKNYVLLIKKHIFDLALKIPSKYRRIWDVSKEVEDIQELLIHVDVLISDYSSVVTDFALLRRPIILYIYDLRRYVEECRDFYFDPRELFPGPFAYSQEELLELLKDLSWFEDPKYREKYEKFLDFFHTYKDGKSCERVERLLMELEGGGNV